MHEVQTSAAEQNWQGVRQSWHWLFASRYLPSGHVVMQVKLKRTFPVMQLEQFVIELWQVAQGDRQAVQILDKDM